MVQYSRKNMYAHFDRAVSLLSLRIELFWIEQ